MPSEIGGFFELELANSGHFHKSACKLNSARNGLRYLIRAHKITKIYIPAFTCPVVWEAIEDELCEYVIYRINEQFLPVDDLDPKEWILYNNYFGICDTQVTYMQKHFPKLIIDQAQSFFSPPTENCVYSPRKFFGLPDGGEVFSSVPLEETFPDGRSMHRISHLIKRIEESGNSAYADFRQNDESLEHEPITNMSNLTHRLLSSIPYEQAAKKRWENFLYLHKHLCNTNQISIDPATISGPMIYPYLPLHPNDQTKKTLIQNKIYVATYWPGQKDTGFGAQLEKSMLALPVDQRYGPEEMDRIIQTLRV